MKTFKNLKVSGIVPGRNGVPARSGLFVSVGVGAVLAALAGAALATPPSGIVSAPIIARATFVDPADVKFKSQGEQGQQVMHAPDLRETVIQQIIIAPGGSTGWHSHPGPAVALIKAGALTLYSSEDPTCTPRTYSAGQAFIDPGQGHAHLGRNLGSENVEVWVTYFDVPAGLSPRVDAAYPGHCGF